MPITAGNEGIPRRGGGGAGRARRCAGTGRARRCAGARCIACHVAEVWIKRRRNVGSNPVVQYGFNSWKPAA